MSRARWVQAGASTAIVFGAFDVLYSNRCLMGKTIAKADEKRRHPWQGPMKAGAGGLVSPGNEILFARDRGKGRFHAAGDDGP